MLGGGLVRGRERLQAAALVSRHVSGPAQVRRADAERHSPSKRPELEPRSSRLQSLRFSLCVCVFKEE